MLIEAEVTTTEKKTVSLNLPAYYKKGSNHYKITDEGTTQVSDYLIIFSPIKMSYCKKEIIELVQQGEVIAPDVFEKAFAETWDRLHTATFGTAKIPA